MKKLTNPVSSFRIEAFTINAQHLKSEFVELLDVPNVKTMRVGIHLNTKLIFGIDYLVNGKRIVWNGLGIASNGMRVGDVLYAAYETSKGGLNYSSKTVKYEITEDLKQNKVFQLPSDISYLNENTILLFVRKGQTFLRGIDFDLVPGYPYSLTWKNMELDGLLEIGDIIEIEYISEIQKFIKKKKITTSVSLELLQSKRILTPKINPNYSYSLEVGRAGRLTSDYDYELINSALSWSNMSLDNSNMLKIGDTIEVLYHSHENLIDQLKLYKVFEKFDASEFLKQLGGSEPWNEMAEGFWKFFDASLGNPITQTIYEKIKNMCQNVVDIETCTIDALYSIAKMVDQAHIFSHKMTIPEELRKIVDIFSVNESYVLESNKMLRDDILESIWESSLVRIKEIYGTEFEYISRDDYVQFIDSFFDGLFRSKLIKTDNLGNDIIIGDGSCFDINESYINFPDKYKFDPTAKIEIHEYEEAKKYLTFILQLQPVSICWSQEYYNLIIENAVKTLRNYCLRISYNRECLKNVIQKYSLIGSTLSVSKLIEEHIRKKFSNPKDWDYFVHDITDALKYPDPEAYINNISSDIIASIYFPHLSQLKNFNVSITEYFDKTQYLNIRPENNDIGNIRYWEGINYDLAKLNSQLDWKTIHEFYKNRMNLTVDKFDIDSTLPAEELDQELFKEQEKFIHRSMDEFATDTYDKDGTLNEFTSQTTNTFKYHQMEDVPESQRIDAPINFGELDDVYKGTDSNIYPSANIINQNYPTIAPQVFLWNLVEKTFRDNFQISNILLNELRKNVKNLISDSGELIDYWKYYAQTFIGYKTYYEASNNLDLRNTENSNVDRDGPFGNPDALIKYLESNIDTINPENFNQFYMHIYHDGISCSELMRLKFFIDEIPKLGNHLLFDRNLVYDEINFKNIVNEQKHFNLVIDGKAIYNHDVDTFKNHYTLYKTNLEKVQKGELWVRLNNHPISFPMAYGFNFYLKSFEEVLEWLAENRFFARCESYPRFWKFETNDFVLGIINSLKFQTIPTNYTYYSDSVEIDIAGFENRIAPEAWQMYSTSDFYIKEYEFTSSFKTFKTNDLLLGVIDTKGNIVTPSNIKYYMENDERYIDLDMRGHKLNTKYKIYFQDNNFQRMTINKDLVIDGKFIIDLDELGYKSFVFNVLDYSGQRIKPSNIQYRRDNKIEIDLRGHTPFLNDIELHLVNNYTVRRFQDLSIGGMFEGTNIINIYRELDNQLIAKWYTDHEDNFFKNVLQVVDPRIQPINIGNLDFDNVQWAANNCYDFKCIGDDIVIVGETPGGKVGLYVFKIEPKISSMDSSYCNMTSITQSEMYFDIVQSQNGYPMFDYIDKIENYVGMYSTDRYIVFVELLEVKEGEAKFNFKFFDRFLRIQI